MNSRQNDTHDCRLIIMLFLALAILAMPWVSQMFSAIKQNKEIVYLSLDNGSLKLTNNHLPFNQDTVLFEAAYPLLFQKAPINTVSKRLLKTIPGIGSKTASLIINKRNELDGFTNKSELETINGLSNNRIDNLLKYITFE